MSDDFDITRFVTRNGKRIAIGIVPSKVTPKKKRPKFVTEWVGFPARWAKALQQSKSVATYQLAVTILFEAYKNKWVQGEETVTLSSAVTKMPRNTRRRAIAELVKLELIKVTQNGHQAPKAFPLP